MSAVLEVEGLVSLCLLARRNSNQGLTPPSEIVERRKGRNVLLDKALGIQKSLPAAYQPRAGFGCMSQESGPAQPFSPIKRQFGTQMSSIIPNSAQIALWNSVHPKNIHFQR
jgi:hypothetical protein